ncbi:hypothetical protein SCHPADRAFT_911695 [Schizopora paradoxa]|uniref:Uncharacterized protein n=1 Tax=Schizopora paradoxa TaxID=27342 RepID=A0A0H2R4D2_9AGAM|nr:hypothetical protein SCHPADRAFT_911695 [Schizopora paradoxa]
MMKLLTTAAVFFISVVLKLSSDSTRTWPPGGDNDNATTLATFTPTFVDTTRVMDSRNFTFLGYSTIRSVRGVLGKTGIDLTEEVDGKLNRVEFKMSSVCHAQNSFAIEILKTVESIWNTTMDRSPFDPITDDSAFSYGSFLEGSISTIPRSLLHLEKEADSIGRDLGDLGERIASLVTSVSDEASLHSAEEHYLFGEALVQFISSVLFVGNISLSVSSVHAHLLQIGVRVAFHEEGNGSTDLLLESLERLYEAALTLVVPAELLETVCVDALL